MAPVIDDGALVFATPRRVYFPGDVVVTARAFNYQVHRVLGYRPSRRGWALITQADDSLVPDPAVVTSRILGRVEVPIAVRDRARAIRRYGKALWQWLPKARQ